ncbi:MAG: ABC transporter ATP-binding protein [Neptuniibacter sp.]
MDEEAVVNSVPAVEIENLRFSWAGKSPIISVDEFKLLRGDSAFIKGPSGSGKSTLLNLLGGVVRPEQGKIRLLGKDISVLKATQIDHFRSDHIGFIFQQFNLLPYLSVLENVLLPCRFSKRRSVQAEAKYGSLTDGAIQLLRQLGFSDATIQMTHVMELSTGQQQRVAAARALLGSPEIIIADEPTSALDTEHRDLFIELLIDQCKVVGSTLLFVSHDPFLESHFNRVEVLQAAEKGGYKL